MQWVCHGDGSKGAILPWDQDTSHSSVEQDAAASFWSAAASFQLQWQIWKAKGPKDLHWLSAHSSFISFLVTPRQDAEVNSSAAPVVLSCQEYISVMQSFLGIRYHNTEVTFIDTISLISSDSSSYTLTWYVFMSQHSLKAL